MGGGKDREAVKVGVFAGRAGAFVARVDASYFPTLQTLRAGCPSP